MPIKPKELERILVNKLKFTPSQNHSSDHKWFELELPGIPTIRTKVSHSRKPINQKIESKIIRQLRVRKPKYLGVISCTTSKEEYDHLVTTEPFPPFDINF